MTKADKIDAINEAKADALAAIPNLIECGFHADADEARAMVAECNRQIDALTDPAVAAPGEVLLLMGEEG